MWKFVFFLIIQVPIQYKNPDLDWSCCPVCQKTIWGPQMGKSQAQSQHSPRSLYITNGTKKALRVWSADLSVKLSLSKTWHANKIGCLFSIISVLVFRAATRYHKLGRLKTTEIYSPTGLETEVWNHSVFGSMLPLKPLKRILFYFFLISGGCQKFSAFLGL